MNEVLSKNHMEFVLKVIVPSASGRGSSGDFCVYLFNPKDKVLLAFDTNEWHVQSLMLAKEARHKARPHVHTVLLQTIKALDGDLLGAVIYGFSEDILFTKLQILKNSELVEIEAKVSDAISTALWAKKPIFVAKEVVDGVGVKVTKELLERSLLL